MNTRGAAYAEPPSWVPPTWRHVAAASTQHLRSIYSGAIISIWLFANQTRDVGVIPKHVGSAGDLTAEVGFVLTAVIHLGWRLLGDPPTRTA